MLQLSSMCTKLVGYRLALLTNCNYDGPCLTACFFTNIVYIKKVLQVFIGSI